MVSRGWTFADMGRLYAYKDRDGGLRAVELIIREGIKAVFRMRVRKYIQRRNN
jgi:hypothetical protein